ncbi:hypothetical protein GCM10008995_27230 [Halobellus salinus]|uniref:Uncharacterized protein n=1 Tax=Halobellus salinus TaxID=931585 RepID=A0A830ETD1_9EURY|nr:hypothetical protein [Halobellus salinus]GGJ15944.1 hypothetical protein GCM10008995_27230 [Halobellus salinus]SMP30172.1 hypothetical protein SAMN06265347_1164 [Halobellus salinus]
MGPLESLLRSDDGNVASVDIGRDDDAPRTGAVAVVGFVDNFQRAYGGADGTADPASLNGDTDRLRGAAAPALRPRRESAIRLGNLTGPAGPARPRWSA